MSITLGATQFPTITADRMDAPAALQQIGQFIYNPLRTAKNLLVPIAL